MFNKFVSTKRGQGIVITIAIVLVLLVVFRMGMSFGYRHALYSYRWGENYERNFVGRMGMGMNGPGGTMFGFGRGGPTGTYGFVNMHASSGQVLSINQNGQNYLFLVKDQDGTEKTVSVASSTILRKFMSTVKINDIKVDDYISVIGSPNNSGQIEAKLIRVFPENLNGNFASSSMPFKTIKNEK